MAILTKDQILNADDLKTERVFVKEWGGEVILRTMKAYERDQFEDSMFKGRGKNRQENMENLRARFLALIIVDEKGKRMFTSGQDIKMLGGKSAAALDFLFTKGRELNGMSDADVEELTTNLDDAQGEDLLSD